MRPPSCDFRALEVPRWPRKASHCPGGDLHLILEASWTYNTLSYPDESSDGWWVVHKICWYLLAREIDEKNQKQPTVEFRILYDVFY